MVCLKAARAFIVTYRAWKLPARAPTVRVGRLRASLEQALLKIFLARAEAAPTRPSKALRSQASVASPIKEYLCNRLRRYVFPGMAKAGI